MYKLIWDITTSDPYGCCSHTEKDWGNLEGALEDLSESVAGKCFAAATPTPSTGDREPVIILKNMQHEMSYVRVN